MKGRAMGLSAASLVVVGTVMLLSLVATPTDAVPFNVTKVLSAYPSYSQLNDLLTSTGVADEINDRSSLTLLVVTNPTLSAFVAANPSVGTAQLGDLLRYLSLLQYLDIPELNTITVGNPSTVTTLYQTTGRAPGNSGSVNIYNNGTSLLVGQADVNTTPSTVITTNLTQLPYNISFLEIDSVLAPTGFGAAPTAANLTAILEAGKNYNLFLNLLQSSGTYAVLAARETGSGITIFAPDDASFNALPAGAVNSLSAAQLKDVLEYHALPAYETSGSLLALNNIAVPTVATASTGSGQFTLSITAQGNAAVINSGISNATVSQILFDSPPTVVYGVGTILLPKEIFAVAAPAPAPSLVPVPAPAPTNASVPVPAPGPLTPTPTPAPSPLSLTPTPAPSPLSPSPTPTPAPTPVSEVPAPVPAAFSPGPPAPPTASIPGEVPASAPEGSTSPPSDATSTMLNSAVIIAVALISTVVLL